MSTKETINDLAQRVIDKLNRVHEIELAAINNPMASSQTIEEISEHLPLVEALQLVISRISYIHSRRGYNALQTILYSVNEMEEKVNRWVIPIT